MNSPASGSSSTEQGRHEQEAKRNVRLDNAPELPQTHRVMPCSSSSSTGSWRWSSMTISASPFAAVPFDCFSLSLPFLFPLLFPPLEADEAEGAKVCLRSSAGSSNSSCLSRLLRWLWDDTAVLDEFARSLLGGWSESGDLEALADAEGAERRPDRLVSLGEGGGPMGTPCGIEGGWTENSNASSIGIESRVIYFYGPPTPIWTWRKFCVLETNAGGIWKVYAPTE